MIAILVGSALGVALAELRVTLREAREHECEMAELRVRLRENRREMGNSRWGA